MRDLETELAKVQAEHAEAVERMRELANRQAELRRAMESAEDEIPGAVNAELSLDKSVEELPEIP